MTSMPDPPDNATPPDAFSAGVRAAAVDFIGLAADNVRRAEFTLAYFLRLGIGHGLTPAEAAAAAGLTEGAVLRLTDPTGGA